MSKSEIEIQNTKEGVQDGVDPKESENKGGSADGSKEELTIALPSELKVLKSKTGFNVDSLVNFKPVSLITPISQGVSPLSLVTRKSRASGTSPAEPVTK